MAAVPSSAVLPVRLESNPHKQHYSSFIYLHHKNYRSPNRHAAFRVHAAKLLSGVEMPKVEPKFKPACLGFTSTAEIWNSSLHDWPHWHVYHRTDTEQGHTPNCWCGDWQRT